jgi:sugar phosphate isomerase/epimerase
MKIGFLTACLPGLTLEEIAPWAASQGFETLELAAWPRRSDRDYMARHIAAENFSADDAERVLDLLEQYDLSISAMAYYDNNLDPNPSERKANLEHVRRVVDAAALLDVDSVGTFVGGYPGDPKEIMKEIGGIFRELVRYASDKGVRLMIENCPMDNWVQFGLPGNYAYSPELWEALFNEVPDENFGLNFDPSHLYWLGIDHNRAATEFASRIFHVHAKDTEMLPDGLYRYGTLSRQLGDDPWKLGWWRYRMPGKGEIDWSEFIDTLRSIGYDDVISIEHEDPEYEGSIEQIKEGLTLGREHLAECREAEPAR